MIVGFMLDAITVDADKVFRSAASGGGRIGGIEPMRDGYDLDTLAADAFANEGKNALQGAWTRYAGEPRYKAMKDRQGGGDRVGIWSGSKNPLDRTFRRGDPEHVDEVNDRGLDKGSDRWYAGTFHAGGVRTPWGEMQPSRPAYPRGRSFRAWGLEVARAFQRAMVGKIIEHGGSLTRVEPGSWFRGGGGSGSSGGGSPSAPSTPSAPRAPRLRDERGRFIRNPS